MVFESLIVSALNHFLGAYVKNLDSSQLKLGIWNGWNYCYCLVSFVIILFVGDALLERLEIKENAFVSNQLNLYNVTQPFDLFTSHSLTFQ